MQNGNENRIPLDLISRFLSGEANLKETDALNEWIAQSSENLRVFEEYRKVWEDAGVLKGKPAFDLDAEWEYLQSKTSTTPSRSELSNFLAGPKFFGSFYRIAAVLVIGLVFGYSIYFITGRTSTLTYTSLSGKETIKLPDGSMVTLNMGAEIVYPKKFSSDNRLVKFTGEGFFQIEKNPQKPFIITSNGLSIRVLGTSFNVKSISEAPVIEVVVSSGKVAVYSGSDREHESTVVPGERAVYDKKLKEIRISENSNLNFLSWKTGKIVFKNSSVPEVLETLSSVYNRKFSLGDADIADCKITVEFSNQELPAVLKILEETLDIQFTVEGDSIVLHGGC